MIPSQAFESFPVFSDTGTKVKPGDAKYSAGFQQSDVLPAEWVNWEWNKASKGITDLNTGLTSVEAEINSVLTGAGKSPDATKTNQLLEAIAKLIDDAETRAKLAAHPIGSLYWSGDPTDPGQLFGGTWAQVKDCFVWAKGDSDTVNATGSNAIAGGSKTVTLTTEQIPSHTHTGKTGNENQSHSHQVSVSDSFERPSVDEAGQVQVSYMANSPQLALLGYKKLTTTNTYTTGSNLTVHDHNFTTDATGGGQAHNNMPPHIIKYCWERTA